MKSLTMAVLLMVGSPALADDPPKNWKGQLAMCKKPAKDVRFGDVIDGKQVYFEFRAVYPVNVIEDREGWLRIFDGYREGWADKDDFILGKDASAFFTKQIEKNPKDLFALESRGRALERLGQLDLAIKDYDAWIGLEPKSSKAYTHRARIWNAKKEYDKAIKDSDEAIRLDPKNVRALYGRGRARVGKKEYEKAFQDFETATRIDPKSILPNAFHCSMKLCLRKPAVEAYQKLLKSSQFNDNNWVYTSVFGYIAAKIEKNEAAAKQFLDAAKDLKGEWPRPLLQYVKGDIDESGLMKRADDNGKQTEARCCIGLVKLLNGNPEAARAHFQWVKDQGNPMYIDYFMAVAELDRLEKKK